MYCKMTTTISLVSVYHQNNFLMTLETMKLAIRAGPLPFLYFMSLVHEIQTSGNRCSAVNCDNRLLLSAVYIHISVCMCVYTCVLYVYISVGGWIHLRMHICNREHVPSWTQRKHDFYFQKRPSQFCFPSSEVNIKKC